MAALPSSDLKMNGQLLSCIPVLVKQSNYPIWLMKIRNTLFAYGKSLTECLPMLWLAQLLLTKKNGSF